MSVLLLASCSSDFLDYVPTGVLSSSNVATAQNAEALVNAAYAGIGNDEMVGLSHTSGFMEVCVLMMPTKAEEVVAM